MQVIFSQLVTLGKQRACYTYSYIGNKKIRSVLFTYLKLYYIYSSFWLRELYLLLFFCFLETSIETFKCNLPQDTIIKKRKFVLKKIYLLALLDSSISINHLLLLYETGPLVIRSCLHAFWVWYSNIRTHLIILVTLL